MGDRVRNENADESGGAGPRVSDVSRDQAERAGLRASDADRGQVAERLRLAHAEGRIDLLEFDQRVASVYAARTYADLAPITADLPSSAVPPVSLARHGVALGASAGSKATPSTRRRGAGGAGGRRGAPVVAWATVSVVNLVIWALVSVGAGSAVYPWWIWVAGPWGVIILLGLLAPRLRFCR